MNPKVIGFYSLLEITFSLFGIYMSLLLGMYACPCYYYPNRSGTGGRPSFVVSVDVKVGSVTADHWIKRGTALLMSLDY